MEEAMPKDLAYYRIKTEYIKEAENGELKRTKSEELVLVYNYTEAEKIAYSIASEMSRAEFGDFTIEIVKEKRIKSIEHNSILNNDKKLVCGLVRNYFSESEDSGVGLYAVKVVFISVDEKGKEKRATEVKYVPATCNSDATIRVTESLKDSTVDYVIRDAKFDRAEAIYWPVDVYQEKTTISDTKQ